MDLSRFFQLAYSGRALLLSGQELEPGSSNVLLSLICKNPKEMVSLTTACERATDPRSVNTALDDAGPTSSFQRIASIPWAAVVTSAVDDRLSRTLATIDNQARRVR